MTAARFHDALTGGSTAEDDAMVVTENWRYLLQLEIDIALKDATGEVRSLCGTLVRLDPHCIEVRLRAGDAFATLGAYEDAARWYSAAGALGTAAGAAGWFRAAQCYELVGDRAAAANAMGRCLELDEAAVEPRSHLERAVHAQRSP